MIHHFEIHEPKITLIELNKYKQTSLSACLPVLVIECLEEITSNLAQMLM